ncbi:unnamed protein product [Angiostrongylus costaricensis]|uniref:non-specific protein-tyrosine kinase n=1 Tax=Angiostrongylus costaricensis TaxID=334426 RepID=A0A0R3PWJ1_ANGCS|nr:unnamed protein product [Angiostrongylus costaricensis]
MLESTHAFNSLCDLINYYRKKPCLFFGAEFILQHPIPPQSWEYHHSDICPGKILGEGAYGMVRAGTLRQKNGKAVKVAIKQSKCHSEMGKAKIKEMMNEARLMRLLKHKNIVHLYGVAVTEHPILIVLELVNGGALNSFLRKHGVNLNVKEKISLCVGAGSGVEYLHQNDCIHRDLAARNCLITEDKVISDFGLSRLGTQYTLKAPMKLPIRWLAPESLETFTFSQKSDVFSFGVLAYEIFSNGGEPWDGMTNAEVRVAVVSGKFLVFPNTCPERLRNFFALRVFAKESPERATMSENYDILKCRDRKCFKEAPLRIL